MKIGQDIVDQAAKHLHENYVYGALTPVGAFASKGPWDCSKFVSAMVYGASGIIYGCDRDYGNPMQTYGGTVYWDRDARHKGRIISVSEAAAIPGAALLRYVANERYHHIVISDGKGGTVEAHSEADGVIQGRVTGRRWTMGILVPDIDYQAPQAVIQHADPEVYRLTDPMMWGDTVKKIQEALLKAGYDVGAADGVYGPQTEKGVLDFQRSHGLLIDGEVGPRTLAALWL